MMSRRREKFWYRVSEKLGIEIVVYGVGDWTHLPGQVGSGTGFGTEDGEMAPWMRRAIDRQHDVPWWFHTHPNMPPFISVVDVVGAHELWDMIRRPFRAVVAGMDDRRVEVTVTENWIKQHPAKPVLPPLLRRTLSMNSERPYEVSGFWCGWCGGFDGQHTLACQHVQRSPVTGIPLALPPLIKSFTTGPAILSPAADLREELSLIMQKFGATAVYEEVDRMVTEEYADRRQLGR